MISDVLERKIFSYPECYTWRKTIAWLPRTTVSGKRVWLKRIYKQKYYQATPWYGQNYKMVLQVEYAEFFDLLREQYENSSL